jgi:hypothetical protein
VNAPCSAYGEIKGSVTGASRVLTGIFSTLKERPDPRQLAVVALLPAHHLEVRRLADSVVCEGLTRTSLRGSLQSVFAADNLSSFLLSLFLSVRRLRLLAVARSQVPTERTLLRILYLPRHEMPAPSPA